MIAEISPEINCHGNKCKTADIKFEALDELFSLKVVLNENLFADDYFETKTIDSNFRTNNWAQIDNLNCYYRSPNPKNYLALSLCDQHVECQFLHNNEMLFIRYDS